MMAAMGKLTIQHLRLALGLCLLTLTACGSGTGDSSSSQQSDAPPATDAATRPVLVVSNNWSGTVDFIDPHTFERLMRLNVIPDKTERINAIMAKPDQLAYFLAINLLIGEGHHQYADDAFTSPDGRYLYVSRPSFADVVAFDLTTRKMVWRTPVAGYRADHMAISPDGGELAVSASTGNVVHIIDTATGDIIGSFPSGDSPHENNYSEDGSRIYHASIGLVYTPLDRTVVDITKGRCYFQVVDAKTLEVLERVDMGQKLAVAGYPNKSSCVRPMVIAPDGRHVYFQVSFFHGFVEYDLKKNKVLRVVPLPKRTTLPRELYLLDSAHHGIDMNQQGTKLCIAGTMDGYAAIVSRQTLHHTLIDLGHEPKPYWVETSADGEYCFVSLSGQDKVAVIDYETERLVTKFAVGDHPQRMRNGRILTSVVEAAAQL